MNHMFPIIQHIDDVLPAIKDHESFRVVEKDWYTVVNYCTFAGNPFLNFGLIGDEEEYRANQIRHECRGLKFNRKTGDLLARPFHKFFNLNEKHDTLEANIDWNVPYYVQTKLDGSMIHPALGPDKNLYFMTKMGVTHVSEFVDQWLKNNSNLRDAYYAFCLDMIRRGVTPIFEFTSLANRIVVEYPKPEMTLLALRENVSGEYATPEEMRDLTEGMDIPTVFSDDRSASDVLDELKDNTGDEGVVIVFNNGHRVKVKTSWYLALHKAKEDLLSDKKVLRLLFSEHLDDVCATLPDQDRIALTSYDETVKAAVRIAIHNSINKLEDFFADSKDVSPKAFALNVKFNPLFRSVGFDIVRGNKKNEFDAYMERVVEIVNKSNVDEFLKTLGLMKWSEVANMARLEDVLS